MSALPRRDLEPIAHSPHELELGLEQLPKLRALAGVVSVFIAQLCKPGLEPLSLGRTGIAVHCRHFAALTLKHLCHSVREIRCLRAKSVELGRQLRRKLGDCTAVVERISRIRRPHVTAGAHQDSGHAWLVPAGGESGRTYHQAKCVRHVQ